MKVLKRLEEYISVIVSNKVPVTDTTYEEHRVHDIVENLEKEFREKTHESKMRFFEECEEKYPELKLLTRDSGYSLDLYSVYGSSFADKVRKRERDSYTTRRKIHERIVLQIELSKEDLNLDEIDTIIYSEIAKFVTPAIEIVSGEEVTDEINQ